MLKKHVEPDDVCHSYIQGLIDGCSSLSEPKEKRRASPAL
jgi:hypothetical protein